MGEKTVRVRCGRRFHRILLTAKGKLVLLDHKDLEAHRVLYALTGEKPRCLEVLEAWREFASLALPKGLQEANVAALQRGLERRVGRFSPDPLEVPLEERLKRRVGALAREALLGCGYRGLGNRMVRVAVEVYPPGSLEEGHIEGIWEKGNPWWDLELRAYIPLRWVRLWRKGLATGLDPEGRKVFVLDILQEDPMVVLAGKQAPGLKVYPQEAQAVEEGGVWRLMWAKR